MTTTGAMPIVSQRSQPPEMNGSSVAVWSRAIALVGIPGVIALFLVWLGGTELPKLIRQTEINYQEQIKTRELLREHIAQSEEELRLMRWICAGVQQNDEARRNCFEK
jgi:hypothetical protein